MSAATTTRRKAKPQSKAKGTSQRQMEANQRNARKSTGPRTNEGKRKSSYNAVTPLDAEASRRLITLLRSRPGGGRMESVLWAASGSEAIQKALWAALARDKSRPMILATRFGFHGKKGLANAVTGSEADAERYPRVRFLSFPMAECRDVTQRGAAFDPSAPPSKSARAPRPVPPCGQ